MSSKLSNQNSVERNGAIAAFAGVACFLALIQVFAIGAGLLHLPFTRWLAILFFVAGAGLAVLFARRFTSASDNTPRLPEATKAVRVIALVWRAIGISMVAWAAWVWVQLWMLARARPPYDWDGLYYHLPAVHEWVMADRVMFIDVLPDIPFVNFPMGAELSVFFAHHLTGGSWLVNAGNLWYWPLAFLAIVVIASRLGARGIWPWIAGAMIVGAPVFVSQSVTCYIDPGFASAVMASVAAALVLVFDRARLGLWRGVLFGLCLGLTLGAKGTGFLFFGVIVVFTIGFCVWHNGVRKWQTWAPSIGIAIVVALLVGGYWYARNAVVTGNPIYPIQLKVGNAVIKDGWDHNQFNDANMPKWLRDHPPATRTFVSWMQTDAPIAGYVPIGGLGYVWPAAAIPSIAFLWVLVAWRRYLGGVRQLAFLSLLVLTLLVFQPAPWWARFTVWLHCLGLPCIAVAGWHAAVSWHRMRWHVLTQLFVVGALALIVWESNRTVIIEENDGRVAGGYKTSLDYMFPGMAEAPGFDRFLQSDRIARSPWGRNGTLFGGILSLPLDKRDIVVTPMQPSGTDIEVLIRDGVEWVVWDATVADDPPVVLSIVSSEYHVFNPSPDVNFHIFKLNQYR